MPSITLQLPPDIERKLRDQAGQLGQTLEAYLQQLAEKAAGNGTLPAAAPQDGDVHGPPAPDDAADFPKYISRPHLTDAEFERNLKELAAGGPLPRLPADFSRADLYDDHD
ncbi:MAG TPA: hypothetical protein VKE74_29185 [Gemmataceae bacterium]|nr:hypothetical protein [Gemmataceae bacterium]